MENSIVKVDMTKIVDNRYFDRIKKIITNKYNKGQPIILSKNFLSRETIMDCSKLSLTEIIESLNSNIEAFDQLKRTPSKRDFTRSSTKSAYGSSVFNKQYLLDCSIKILRKRLKKFYPLMDVEKMTKEEIIDFILADVPEELL